MQTGHDPSGSSSYLTGIIQRVNSPRPGQLIQSQVTDFCDVSPARQLATFIVAVGPPTRATDLVLFGHYRVPLSQKPKSRIVW